MMMSQKLQVQIFQAALIIVGMTCLFASEPSSEARASRGLSRNAIAAESCDDLRRVAVNPDSVLNLRVQPNGTVLRQLRAGQSVSIQGYDSSGAWAQVSVGGEQGWVFNQYLAAGC